MRLRCHLKKKDLAGTNSGLDFLLLNCHPRNNAPDPLCVSQCAYLRLDPHTTPLFPQYPEYYFDVNTGQWTPMPEPHPRQGGDDTRGCQTGTT